MHSLLPILIVIIVVFMQVGVGHNDVCILVEAKGLCLHAGSERCLTRRDMSACQSYGPFLDLYYNTAPNI